MSKPQPATQQQFHFPDQAISFDPDAFDLLIRTQGVDMVHYRALPCPVGLIDPDDQRHPREHHTNCSNGHLYILGGNIICSFLSNSKESRAIELGRTDSSTVTVTFPRYYEKDNPSQPDVEIHPTFYDRLYLKDEKITVVTKEKFACSATGVDKLRYPVVKVDLLVDARGKAYYQGTDFNVVGGEIVWNKSPGIDAESNRGVVCSVRYEYRPFWYVARMIHEVRVAQVENMMGERETMRFNQQMLLQREVVFENEQADALAKQTPRQNPGPNDSGINVTGNLGTK